MKKNILLDLFLTFMKIGLFTFGGGYAMISIVEDSCVKRKEWISHDDMMNLVVIAESTPGPIAVNCATFVGYRQAGFLGALSATLGMIVPSFAVIYVIAMFWDNLLGIAVISNAFQGIKIAVGILILDVAITMMKKISGKTLPCILMGISFVVMLVINLFSLKISSISIMMTAAVVNLAMFVFKDMQIRKGGAGQ